MKVVILAGGRGTRLMPLTNDIPKPMIEINGKPNIEHQVMLLRENGFNEIIICGHYLIDKIKDYFGNGEKFCVRIKYPMEKEPLGTGGAIKNAKKFISDDFLILYGDIFVDINLKKLVEFHREKNADITLTLHRTDHPHDSSLVIIDKNGKVTKIFPKPNREPFPSQLAKSSVFVCKKGVLGKIPAGKSNFEEEVIPRIVNDGTVYGYVTGEFLKDFGTPERLEKVKKYWRSKSGE